MSNLSETKIFKLRTLKSSIITISYLKLGILVFLLAITIGFGFSIVLKSSEIFVLQQENARYKKNLKLIQDELNNLNDNLTVLQQKDDSLYRLVLGVNPISQDIRQAGIGGSNLSSKVVLSKDDLAMRDYFEEYRTANARLNVQKASFHELTTIATENINRIQHKPAIFPIAPDDLIRFASGFGYRTHPIFQTRMFHKGIDLTALKGTPVYAPAKGTVIIAGNLQDGYGNKVVIDHGYGYKTVYAHLHKINVKVGQDINLGDEIALVGNTGLSVAPHLHYEVRFDDQVVNPLNFVYKDISSEEYNLITKR